MPQLCVRPVAGWLRQAPNPQCRRRSPDSSPPDSVNLKTGEAFGTSTGPGTILPNQIGGHRFTA
jgi:hypothetical protein